MELCDKIRARRQSLGLTMEDVAREVGVSKPTVQRWESGVIANMRRDKIAKLAKALHTTPAYLMGWTDNPINYEDGDLIASISPSILEYFNGDVEKSLAFLKKVEDDALSDAYPSNTVPYTPGVPVRVIGSVKCGYNGIAYENLDGYELADVKDSKDYIWLKVNGDSMEPRIHDGDYALIRIQPDVDSGDIAVVILNGDEGTLKKVIKQDGAIVLQPFNPSCTPQLIAGEKLKDLRIFGKVIENKTKW